MTRVGSADGSSADIVNEFLESFWAGDRARLLAVTDPGFAWENICWREFTLVDGQFQMTSRVLGADELCQSSERLALSLVDPDSGRHEVIREWDHGDVVVQERYDRMRVNGIEVEMICCGVWELTGGRVSLWRDYFALDHWRQQMKAVGVEINPETGSSF